MRVRGQTTSFPHMQDPQAQGRPDRMGWPSIAALVLSFLLLMVVWLSETGNLPGGYNKRPVDHAGLVMLVITVILGACGALVGLLLALIPSRRHRFWVRFTRRFPFALLFFSLLAVIGSALSAMTWQQGGFAMEDRSTLHDRPIPSVGLCRSVHDGHFKLDGIDIHREGNRQFEYYYATDKRMELELVWLTPCSYRLRSLSDSTAEVFAHIVSVDGNGGYECLVEQADGQVVRWRVQRR